ncbi:hypothetical protein P9112_001922 [Eukaryota sp. TZLM1-RC]
MTSTEHATPISPQTNVSSELESKPLTSEESSLAQPDSTEKEAKLNAQEHQESSPVPSDSTTEEAKLNAQEHQESSPVPSDSTTEEAELNAQEQQESSPVPSDSTTEEAKLNAQEQQQSSPVPSDSTTEEVELNAQEQQESSPVPSDSTTEEAKLNAQEQQESSPIPSDSTTEEVELNAQEQQESSPVPSDSTTEEVELNAQEEQVSSHSEESSSSPPNPIDDKPVDEGVNSTVNESTETTPPEEQPSTPPVADESSSPDHENQPNPSEYMPQISSPPVEKKEVEESGEKESECDGSQPEEFVNEKPDGSDEEATVASSTLEEATVEEKALPLKEDDEVDLDDLVGDKKETGQAKPTDSDENQLKAVPYKALYSFQARVDNELSFDSGEIIMLLEKHESGMWKGKKQSTGRVAYFPYNYCEPLHPSVDHSTPPFRPSVRVASQKTNPFAVKHQGFMSKQGSFFRTWRRRFFVLRNSALSYYKDNTDTKPKNTIHLTPLSSVEPISRQLYTSLRVNRPISHCLMVSSSPGSRVFYFIADSEVERNQWIESIRSAIPLQ